MYAYKFEPKKDMVEAMKAQYNSARVQDEILSAIPPLVNADIPTVDHMQANITEADFDYGKDDPDYSIFSNEPDIFYNTLYLPAFHKWSQQQTKSSVKRL